MRTRLVLLRHAKAERHGVSDRERPLTTRGRADAVAVGQWLTAQGVAPGRVVISPALRTRETWELAAAGALPEPELDDRIYDGTVDLVTIMRETPPEVHTLVLVGHNPPVGLLAMTWAPELVEFRPGSVAIFEMDDWTPPGRLIESATPRSLRNSDS